MHQFLKLSLLTGTLITWGVSFAQPVKAVSITLQGSFTQDDQVALFDVVVNPSSFVDIRSYGYAGGTTSTGILIPQGGFDPVLTLFSSSGDFIAENDEGAGALADLTTGQAWDPRLQGNLTAGTYVIALTQYGNFSIGSLSDGFLYSGQPNFTADPDFSPAGPCPGGNFRDTSGTDGRCRNGNWAIEFVNVASVTQRDVSVVPEPASLALLSFSLLAFGVRLRQKSSN